MLLHDRTAHDRTADSMEDWPDSKLLKDRNRPAESFGVLYDRHIQDLLRFFARRTGSGHLAADLTAETFAKALACRYQYREQSGTGRAWLFGIGKHELAGFFRRRRVSARARARLGLPRLAVDDVSLERIEELVDLEPIRRILDDARARLRPLLAEAVELRLVLQLPYREVARRLKCSEGAARVRVARGLSQLRDLLEVHE